MDKIIVLINVLILFLSNSSFSQRNYLEKSLSLYSKGLNDRSFQIKYEEINNYLSHSMDIGDIGSSTRKGTVWLNNLSFQKADTLYAQNGKIYYSKVMYHQNKLHVVPYGKDNLKEVTQTYLKNFIVSTLSYTPILLLEHFNKQGFSNLSIHDDTDQSVSYSLQVGEYFVTIEINKKNHQILKVTTLSDLEEDDQYYGFGDVINIYSYIDNHKRNDWLIPMKIIKLEQNEQLIDTVKIKEIEAVDSIEEIITPPKNYSLKIKDAELPDISIEKYSNNIYLINLHHCGTRSLLVEFKDFLLVAEAPLNSKYGEQVLAEVKKINHTKPIKYFVFGHFHPHYTGGIRPFIHQGAKVICLKEDNEYIVSIAKAKYTIKPDSLEISQKKVLFDNIYQAKTVSDGDFYMTIYHIGKKSNHTNDYLIYYFPKEKMIFEDDLIWINENTNKSNLSELTKGFYQAVKDLNLDVEEIVQNWGVFDKDKSMIFQFEKLEKILENE